ncbi:MAG: hypothetical protein K0S32_15 [Bacteroidetes bacterium]|jgi:hypothetical protein|nr:hypothetical protein [Bacteroidota bacterium]
MIESQDKIEKEEILQLIGAIMSTIIILCIWAFVM